MVTPYQTRDSKKEQVTNMFNKISNYYDFLNHFLSMGIDRRWRKKAIRNLWGTNAKDILDVATGTGDLAIEAYNQLRPCKITGLDISPKMIEIGIQKCDKQHLSDHIRFVVGDSEALPMEDQSFDAVTVAFGVRNFENLDAGIAEMRRVLRPGGKMVILEFSKPRVWLFKKAFNIYFKYILPLIGRITSKDPRAYAYLYESVQSFPDGKDFGLVLEKAGLTDVTITPFTWGICTCYTAVR